MKNTPSEPGLSGKKRKQGLATDETVWEPVNSPFTTDRLSLDECFDCFSLSTTFLKNSKIEAHDIKFKIHTQKFENMQNENTL